MNKQALIKSAIYMIIFHIYALGCFLFGYDWYEFPKDIIVMGG